MVGAIDHKGGPERLRTSVKLYQFGGANIHVSKFRTTHHPMLAKTLVVLLLIAIVVSLVLGGIFLVRDSSTSRRTVKALTWRVGLQVLLMVVLIVAFFAGWIEPHGVGG